MARCSDEEEVEKPKKRKVKLDLDVLRKLTEAEARQVAGGTSGSGDCICTHTPRPRSWPCTIPYEFPL